MVTKEELEFSGFVNDVTRNRIHLLPYSSGTDDVAQEVMIDLWKQFGPDWIDRIHKTKYYGLVLKVSQRRAVDLKRKAFGRYEGSKAAFEHIREDERLQTTFVSPDFYTGLASMVESAAEAYSPIKQWRNDAISDEIFTSRKSQVEISASYGVAECSLSVIKNKAREYVMSGLPR